MQFDTYHIGKKYFGEIEDCGFGHSRCFVTLPPNPHYAEGYGFYIGSSLITEGYISLPDDYKIELLMTPELREPGKRYKRYRMTGKELASQIFDPYMDSVLKKQMEIQRQKERRYKRIKGDIVYGIYKGSRYDFPDQLYDFYFVHDGMYYNKRHEKVKNVVVESIVFEGVTKLFYDKSVDILKRELENWITIGTSIKILLTIKEPGSNLEKVLRELESERSRILDDVKRKLPYL